MKESCTLFGSKIFSNGKSLALQSECKFSLTFFTYSLWIVNPLWINEPNHRALMLTKFQSVKFFCSMIIVDIVT